MIEHKLKRKISDYLLMWKNNPKKVPLVIKGLRQIGKTFVVKEFAKANYDNAFILDFRKQTSLSLLFEGDFNIDDIILSISSLSKENNVIKNSKMVPYKTLLIFDEIQDCPNARSSLRYFKEDKRFDVICTGSLLGVEGYLKTKKPSRGIAVGSEEQITMYPMDFEEFLWALNIDDNIILKIKDCVDKKTQIPPLIHEQFLKLIRQYICVGGMPEVVLEFLSTNDMNQMRRVQRRLLDDYKADFGIHLDDNNQLIVNDTERIKLLEVFNSIPKQLAKENKKFQYKVIDKKAIARTHLNALNWLKNYGLIDISYNLSTVQKPYDFFAIQDQFKVYVSDIGLLCGMLDDDIPFRILTNDLSFGKGAIYENLLADALHKDDKKMYYFSKQSGLEIDFVTSISSKSYLVEAKAMSGNTKSSKIVFNDKNSNVDGIIKLTSQNIGYIEPIFTVPYYLSFYLFSK